MTGPSDNNVTQAAGGKTAGTQGSFLPVTDASPAPAQPGEDMHRGWVKLWRKWRDHEMASDPNATLVFLHLLTEARREPKINRRFGYTVQRGQTDLTLGQLAELTSLSVGQVRQALGRLEKYETIKRSTQNGKVPALTTIVNFDTYNPDTNPSSTHNDTPAATEQHINDNSAATPGEVEKGEKGKTTTPPRKRGVRGESVVIPDDLKAYDADIRAWFDYRWKRKPAIYDISLDAAFDDMRRYGKWLPSAIKKSIANGWQGLPEMKQSEKRTSARSYSAADDDAKLYEGL